MWLETPCKNNFSKVFFIDFVEIQIYIFFHFPWVLCSQDKWSFLGTDIYLDQRSILVYENTQENLHAKKKSRGFFFFKSDL